MTTCPINWDAYLRYEPETGKLYWRQTMNSRAPAGAEAGSSEGARYRKLKFKGKFYQCHRVIWDMLNPGDLLTESDRIDHIDHDRLNNRIDNLRKVSCAVNSRNMSKPVNNTSGVIGVHWYRPYNKWQAQISVENSRLHLGYFDSFHDAIAARKAAEIKYGFHKNHGKSS